MGPIVAIGGGKWERGFETRPIDEEIVSLTGRERPRVLFVPTAGGDDEERCAQFRAAYGELGCETDVLRLLDGRPRARDREAAIRRADAVYVGGGNTRMMMGVWAETGVDRLLREAHAEGTVLAGVSAGAICWCAAGHSDSESFGADDDGWEYVRVEGLGLLGGVLYCPHYHAEGREASFREFVRADPYHVGIGVDDNAALVVTDGGYRIAASRAGGVAYRLYVRGGEVVDERLPRDELRPLAELRPTLRPL